MMHRFFCFLLIVCLMSCSHKADIIFGDPIKAAIDESKTVLLRYPQNLSMVSDSTVMMINSGQRLSEYNFYSGINTRNFSLGNFNFDSLITVTYRKKYEGVKTFDYGNGYELNGSNYQLVNYFHAKNANYVMVSLLAAVDNLQDSSALVKLREDEKKFGIDRQDAHITIMDYVNFIFETDADLKIRTIYPLYAEARIRKDNYFAYFHKNFFVQNNAVYVPVAKTGNVKLAEKIDADKGNYSMVRIGLQENSVNYLLPYAAVDFTDYRLQDYFGTDYHFLSADNRLLVCTGKEIIENGTSEKIFSNKELAPTEWIYDCCKKEDLLIMMTYTMEHKKSIVMNGASLPVDSILKEEMKIFDPAAQKFLCSKQLPADVTGPALSGKRLVYITKDDTHYYLNSMTYEN